MSIDRTLMDLPQAPVSADAPAEGIVLTVETEKLPLVIVEPRSEEHTSELQSLMHTSYAVFCFKKKKTQQTQFSHLPHQFKTTQAIYENNMNDTKICTYIHSYMTT